MSRERVRRSIVHADALAWMADNPAALGVSIVTSLPDVSELSGASFDVWRALFGELARRCIAWVPSGGVAIFYQSDIRHGGAWVDKGYLVMRAAEDERAILLWHKIVCRHPPGTISLGRPRWMAVWFSVDSVL